MFVILILEFVPSLRHPFSRIADRSPVALVLSYVGLCVLGVFETMVKINRVITDIYTYVTLERSFSPYHEVRYVASKYLYIIDSRR